MVPRLDVIDTDLLDRRSRAKAEHSLGEIEGIDLTLKHLTEKRRHAQRLVAGRVPIGMPHPRTPRERTR